MEGWKDGRNDLRRQMAAYSSKPRPSGGHAVVIAHVDCQVVVPSYVLLGKMEGREEGGKGRREKGRKGEREEGLQKERTGYREGRRKDGL